MIDAYRKNLDKPVAFLHFFCELFIKAVSLLIWSSNRIQNI